MKKPKISKGKWEIEKDTPTSDFGTNWSVRAKKGNVSDGVAPVIFNHPDAKAIAAVPEMIDALMNIENDDGSIPDTIWEMRNKALQKAGCEF